MPLIYYIPRRDAATGEITTVVDTNFSQTTLLISSNAAPLSFNTDSSNFANDITVVGDARASSYTPYLPSWSGYFDGTGDYLSVPSSAAFAFGTGDFTIEAWVNFPANSTYRQIFSLRPSNGTNASQGSLAVNPSNGLVWYTGGPIVDYTSSIGVNQWVHVAVSRAGTTLRVFANGVLVGSATNSDNLTSTNFTIGANNNGTEPFNGYISNLRVVKGTAVYTANFIPPTSPLTAISGTSLLTLQDNRFFDKSPNNFAITKNGDTVVSPFNPFATQTVTTPTTYSTYFDGTGDYLSVPSNAAFAFGTGDFTVEAWVYLTTTQPNSFPTIYGASTGGGFIFAFRGTTPTSLAINAYGSGDTLTASFSFSFNTWYHVAASRSGTTARIFVNGILINSGTDSNSYGQSTMNIGAINGSQYMLGYISNLRVVKGTALYTANFTPATSPLTAIAGTSLLTCQNATLIDNSTNNFTITSAGQAQPSTINPFGSLSSSYSSTYSSALTTPTTYSTYFDGSGDYITMPTDNALLALGSANFTFEAWVYRISGTGTALVFGGQSNMASAGGSAYGFLLSSTATSDLYISNTSYSITSPNPSLGVWAHVAWVRNGGTFTSYLNGVQVGSRSDLGSGSVNTGTTQYPPGIGGMHYSGGINLLNGYISNARLVKGTAVYTSNFTPPTTPLTAIAGTSFLACQGSTTSDSSANNIPLTIYGQVQQTRVNPFGFTSAGTTALTKGSTYFDGTGDYLTVPGNPGFNFGTGDFTIEAFIYWDGTYLNGGRIICATGGSGSLDQFCIFASPIGLYYAGVNSNAFPPTNAWSHVAASRQGSTVRLFINGVIVATSTNANSIGSSTATMFIGTRPDTGNHLFFGYISNLRIVNGTAVYTSNFLPPTEPLTAITNTVLLTCQNSNPHNNHTFVNSATGTSNLVLTRSGNATQTSISPYAASWGGYFASSQYISTPASSEFAFGTGDFTVECWLNPLAQTGVNIIQSSASNSWGLITFGSQIYWQQNGGNFGTAAGTVPTNSWSHIAITRSSGTLRRFLDGVLLNSVTDNFNYSGTAGKQIGVTGGGAPYLLSNVRIVKGTALYTADFTPSTTPLTAVAGTALLTLQNDQFIDNSSNKFALTLTGAPTPALNNNTQFALNTLPTPTTYSGYFDGSGDYLSVPSNAAFALGTSYTIELWHYRTGTASTGSYTSVMQLVNTNPYGTTVTGFMLTYDGSNAFNFRDSSSNIVLTYNSTNLALNTWYHVAIVRNGSGSNNMTMYINGVSVATGTSSSTQVTNVPVVIGGDSNGNCSFPGYISNLRIVKGTAVYTSAFTPSTSPLTAISGTALLTCQNSTFIDNSTNNFTITSSGQAKPSAINPFGSTSATADGYSVTKFKGSLTFSGSSNYILINNNPALNLTGSSWTVECWIKPTGDYSTFRTIFAKRVSGTNTTAYEGYLKTSTGVVSYFNGTNYESSTSLAPEVWSHVAWVHDKTNIRIFVNGILVLNVAAAVNEINEPLIIGGARGLNEWFNGNIADFRVIKGEALYRSNFLPSSVPLTPTSNTVLMLDCSAGAIVDATGKNPIETVGDARISNKAVKYGTTAMYFDGTGDWLHIPPSTNFEFGSGNFTVEFWFYTASTSRQWFIHSATDYWFGIDYNCTGTNKLGLWASSNGTTWNLINADPGGNGICATTLPQRQWNHIAVTRSGNVWRVFLNGTQDLSVTVAGSIVNRASQQKVIGSWAISSHAYPVNGYLSDFRVTKGTARYTANFTPPTAELPKL